MITSVKAAPLPVISTLTFPHAYARNLMLQPYSAAADGLPHLPHAFGVTPFVLLLCPGRRHHCRCCCCCQSPHIARTMLSNLIHCSKCPLLLLPSMLLPMYVSVRGVCGILCGYEGYLGM
jgi:hypothetical protein